MIQENTISYIQKNTYKKIKGDDVSVFRFDRILRVTPLAVKSEKQVFYDEELNICYESPVTCIRYEIEIEKARTYFDKKFFKLEDFHRRITYRYDWMKVKVDSNGISTVIDNFDEMRRNWFELVSYLKKDYIGASVNSYLENITEDFKCNDNFQFIVNNYFYYGLLFPPIPYEYKKEWIGNRSVLFPDVSAIHLSETIEPINSEETRNTYRLKAEMVDSHALLTQYEGEICVSTIDHMVQQAVVKLQYANNLINDWTFSIERIENK